MPRGGPVDSIYRQHLLAARNRSAALTRATEQRILQGFAESLVRLDIAEGAGRITPQRARALHEQISTMLFSFEDKFDQNVAQGIKTTITDVLREHDRALAGISDAFGVTARAAFDNVDVEVALNLATRRGADSFRSLMKYRLDNQILPQIDTFLSSAASRGVSVGETTTDLVRLMANGDQQLLDALAKIPRGANISRLGVMQSVDLRKYGIDEALTSRIRSLYADGRRITVSELNNTLRETNAEAMARSPVVEAATWQRSGAHMGPCECDIIAETDFYGYGPGAYPPEKWPVAPHPNCGCYQGGPMVYRSPKDWSKPKPKPRPIQRNPTDPRIYQRHGLSENRMFRAQDNIMSALGEGEMRAAQIASSVDSPMLPGETKLEYQKRRKKERAAERRKRKQEGFDKPVDPLPEPKPKPKLKGPGPVVGELPKLRKSPDFAETGTWELDHKGRTFKIYRDPESKWWYEDPGRTHQPHTQLFRGFTREEAIRRQIQISDELPPILKETPPPTVAEVIKRVEAAPVIRVEKVRKKTFEWISHEMPVELSARTPIYGFVERFDARTWGQVIDKAPLADISTNQLIALQETVERQSLINFIRNPDIAKKRRGVVLIDESLPIVIKHDGKLYIFDGTHRVAAQKMQGAATIRARYIDLDALERPGGPTPPPPPITRPIPPPPVEPPIGLVGNPNRLPGETPDEFKKRRQRERREARKKAAKAEPEAAPVVKAEPKAEPARKLETGTQRLAHGPLDGGLSKTQLDDINEVLNKVTERTHHVDFFGDLVKAILGEADYSRYTLHLNRKLDKGTGAYHTIAIDRFDNTVYASIHMSEESTKDLIGFLEAWKSGMRGTRTIPTRQWDSFRIVIHEALHGISPVTANPLRQGAYGIEKHRFLEEGLTEWRAKRATRQIALGVDDARGSTFLNDNRTYTREVNVIQALVDRYGTSFADDMYLASNANKRFDTIMDAVRDDISKIIGPKTDELFDQMFLGLKGAALNKAHAKFLNELPNLLYELKSGVPSRAETSLVGIRRRIR